MNALPCYCGVNGDGSVFMLFSPSILLYLSGHCLAIGGTEKQRSVFRLKGNYKKNKSRCLRLFIKEGNVLFNDALNTFYLWLYGIGHMVEDHSDSERGNPLSPHGLLLSINSKGSFICTIPQTG